MENDAPQQSSGKSKVTPIAITLAVVVIIAVAAIAFTSSGKSEPVQEEVMAQQETATPTITAGEAQSASAYADGEYQAEGMYTSPGGAESIDVTLTLKNGVVTDAEVQSNATRPTSKQMQASFIEGYKEQVIGRKIDEINLTKVSASSLAPKGFNDAVQKIKAEAQA